MSKYRVLVVDDDLGMLEMWRTILEAKGYAVLTAPDGPEALESVETQLVDVAVVDLGLPSMDGLHVMREILRTSPDTAVLIITGNATLDTAIQAVREGAFDFIPKPFRPEELEVAVERSISHRQVVEQNRHLQRELREAHQFGNVVAHSPQMIAVLNLVRKVAPTDSSVLLLGESGTGKELVARCLHEASGRARETFVPIDCASLPETLLESELFGYEKGAFTGATTSRAGLLESARGGTVFLDEIGNVSANLQAKLLRVLEERHFRRVGGRVLLEVDARFISATNSSLEEMVRRGTFREDLFYRLNVVSISLPPLRDRAADIAALAEYFLEAHPSSVRKGICGISSAAVMALQSYRWPGNVRELKNVIWRAVSLTESNQITPFDLPAEMLHTSAISRYRSGQFRQAKRQAIEEFEKAYLQHLMADNGGNVSQAARQAGLKRSALHRLLQKHGFRPAQYRASA